MNAVRFTVIVFAVLLLTAGALAQDNATCPAIAKDALAATDLNCESTGRNQACYGNVKLDAEPQPNVEGFVFDTVGDMVDVAGVKTIRLSEMKVDTGDWGVALMRIQANLPDTLPGQNVTFLLFGDTEITNAVDPTAIPPTIEVTAQGNANLRGTPSTGGAVVGSLAAGDIVTADGRLTDSSWLRLQLPDDGGTAWVFAQLVTTEGDLTTLNVVDPSDTSSAPSQKPMQAFYFRSGIGDSPCTEAPDSGILIQTPEGAEKISLTVNEVKLELGSTAFLEAEAGKEMLVNVVEGSGSVESEGVTQIIPAGTFVSIPMSDDLTPAGPPSAPQPYDISALEALPVSSLERQITIAPALSQEEIDALMNMNPTPGKWLITSGEITAAGGCPAGLVSYFPKINQVIDITSSDFTTAFTAIGQEIPAGMTFSNPSPGVWIMDYATQGATVHDEIDIISPTRMEALMTMNVAGGCVITLPYTLELIQ